MKEHYELQNNFIKDEFLGTLNRRKKKLKEIMRRFVEEVEEDFARVKPKKVFKI